MKGFLQTRWGALLLLVISYALIFNKWVPFPFPFMIIILFVLFATLLQDEKLRSLNFRKLEAKDIKTILLSYLVIELSVDFIFDPIINWICNESADYSMFKPLENNTPLYTKWMFMMWISAAFGEELLFRSFMFSQLQRILGNKKTLMVLITAVLFAIPHMYQGIAGIISTFVFGVLFGILYMRYQNLWVNVIVHGLVDTLFLTLSYLGLTGFYDILW